MSKQED